MHRGDCYPNGSYFWDERVTLADNGLMCSYAGHATQNLVWIAPNGTVANCNTGVVRCSTMAPNNGSNLYLTDYVPEPEEGFYKCCPTTDCSNQNVNNVITANIFSKTMNNVWCLLFHL